MRPQVMRNTLTIARSPFAALPDAFRRRAKRPAVVGHRGVRPPSGGAGWHVAPPENTLAAFAAARAQGADAVELDARPCGSGELVVFHDPDLWRARGDTRKVHAVPLAELSRIDLGGGERMPRLSDVLDFAAAAGLGVNVELKHDAEDRAGAVRALAREIAAARRGLEIVVSSFDPWMLRSHRALAPKVAHALLVHRSAYHGAAFAAARLAGLQGVHVQGSLVSEARVRALVRRGFVNVWTVNDRLLARRAFELGASALITDEPARLRATFE